MNDNWSVIDVNRTACLCPDGAPGFVAAVAVAADGTEHLLLAERDSINDETATYDASCGSVEHEQLGPLPIDVLRRITIAHRAPRCGRRTQAGTPMPHPRQPTRPTLRPAPHPDRRGRDIMSRRDRRQRRHTPTTNGAQPEVSAEDLNHSKTLALRVIREILNRNRPDEHARVCFAIYEILNSSRGTAVGTIAFLAQLAAEGIERDIGTREGAIDEVNRELAAAILSADSADSTEPT